MIEWTNANRSAVFGITEQHEVGKMCKYAQELLNMTGLQAIFNVLSVLISIEYKCC